MLTRIKRDGEELLKLCFENYHLLSSNARKGILEVSCCCCLLKWLNVLLWLQFAGFVAADI